MPADLGSHCLVMTCLVLDIVVTIVLDVVFALATAHYTLNVCKLLIDLDDDSATLLNHNVPMSAITCRLLQNCRDSTRL